MSIELYESEMHNGLWRGMFAPTPILPMTWWWEWHLYKNEYFHFKMAENFVSKMLNNNDDIIEEVKVNTSEPNLEIMGLKVGSELFIWMLNKNESQLNNVEIELDDFADDNYFLKTYNTWTGKYSDSINVKIYREKLKAKNLKLRRNKDMALWLKPRN